MGHVEVGILENVRSVQTPCQPPIKAKADHFAQLIALVRKQSSQGLPIPALARRSKSSGVVILSVWSLPKFYSGRRVAVRTGWQQKNCVSYVLCSEGWKSISVATCLQVERFPTGPLNRYGASPQLR
jgi:hypothetical protein